jgi:hypothetical protein
MDDTPTHYRPAVDRTAAPYVRFALALWGYEAGAVRVRAVTNKYRELGEDGALRWAFRNTALQVARDIRAISAVFAYRLYDIRRVIAASAGSVEPAVAFDAPDRLRIHDAAVATLAQREAA